MAQHSNDQLEFFFLQNVNASSNDDDSSIVIDDSDTESNSRTAVDDADETNEDYFEIYIPDDDDDEGADVSNQVAEAKGDNSIRDSLDADGDKAFGKLIVGELRKMTPAAQQEFKRKVTQFLYS